MRNRRTRAGWWCLAACGILLAVGPTARAAEDPTGGQAPGRPPEEDIAARALLRRATDLLSMQEHERGVKMLETLLEQYPDSPVRYEAYLAIGKHFLERHEQPKAISYLARLRELRRDDEPMASKDQELYLEGLYLTGVANFQTKQYRAAFAVLRKITKEFPNTVWANQAYYYIGMGHFAQRKWSEAIRNLSLVGTFVDPDSPTVQYVEAGHRFYVKVDDADLPVLHRLGRTIGIAVETAGGDAETVACIPLSEKQGVFISSIGTEVGPATKGDHTLQVVGGDEITARYVDDNTKEGQKDVLRQKQVKVVSTGALKFVLGTFESAAAAAYLGQPLFVLLHDADLDTSGGRDRAMVRIVARYKVREEETFEEGEGGRIDFREERETYKIRDEVELTLSELGDEPVHSGRFGGQVAVEPFREDRPVDKTDPVLVCDLDDEVVATYVDERHIAGEAPREALARIQVVGEIDASPRATQNVVADPVLRSKKNLVEATAYLELARIFKSMGLSDGAKTKAEEGLDRTDGIIRIETPIPSSLKEEAFKLKWELYIVQEDFASAVATCQLFNRLYPDSPFVDQALLGIGRIKFENEEFAEAINVFKQILDLENSQAKAEALHMIARATEARGPEYLEAAVQQYKLCASRFPDSEFAGPSLGKLVNYHIETKDYTQANDLLDQIFQDYPDAEFLDSMLLKWVLVAFRMGDYQKAHDKCSQLIFEYPASQHAKKAKALLPRIQEKLGQPGGSPGGPDEGDESDPSEAA